MQQAYISGLRQAVCSRVKSSKTEPQTKTTRPLKESDSQSDKSKYNDDILTFVQQCIVCDPASDIFSHFTLSIIL